MLCLDSSMNLKVNYVMFRLEYEPEGKGWECSVDWLCHCSYINMDPGIHAHNLCVLLN